MNWFLLLLSEHFYFDFIFIGLFRVVDVFPFDYRFIVRILFYQVKNIPLTIKFSNIL